MNQRDQYKRLLTFAASAALLLILTGIFAWVWYHFFAFSNLNGKPFYRRGHWVVIGLYLLLLFLFGRLFGGFNVGSSRVLEGIYSQIFSVLCSNFVIYLIICLIATFRFLTSVEPILIMTVADCIVAVGWVLFTRWGYVKLYPPRKLLLIHGDYDPQNLIRKIGSRKDKYDIAEAVHIDMGMDELLKKIDHYRNILLMDIPDKTRNTLLKYCFRENIRCYCVPKLSDIMVKSSSDIFLFDTTLMLFRNMGMTKGQAFIKRCFDIAVSLIGLIVAFPFMLIIAVCIKAYDKGPLFFTQDRLTKDGKIFKVYKFRSMKVAPKNEAYVMTRKDDDRITPIGKIIRNIHFDELPQLINILKGDMSIVGPRPECPDLTEKYSQIVPEFKYRLKVKGGLTGFAQVYGKYNTTPYDKLKLDLMYIENYSFLLDIKILFLTVKILFQKENTEGIESWQTSAATVELPKEPEEIRK
ncbi:MAG: exopolysaccharide biosynthesis polyprenyl glycosylphosphotransferase [Oscillospiraceae bacterium]|nr:exopolysaccharide biosynthesis polyprenyl glycosylphosphotransferase [Oscillospiraceae bacterium]